MPPNPDLVALVQGVLSRHPTIQLAILFGSGALGEEKFESDVDLAVDAGRPLEALERMALMGEIAEATGRPVDLIDLSSIGEPLLGQVLKHGVRIRGSATRFGTLLSRHLVEAADFLPLRNRILDERRSAPKSRNAGE